MPALVAENLSHEEFHAHIAEHDSKLVTAAKHGMEIGEHEKHEPKHAPKGDGHHYHKHKDHSPAANSASCFVLPDMLFGIAFIGCVAMQFSFCFTWGTSTATSDDDEGRGSRTYQKLMALTIGVAVVMSFIFIKILVKIGTGIIKCIVFTCIGIIFALGLVCVAYDEWKIGCPFFAVGLLAFIYFMCNMGHIEFAGACLEVSCHVIAKYPATEVVALGMTLAMSGWSMVFSMSLTGLQNYIMAEGKCTSIENLAEDQCSEEDIKTYFIAWVGIILTFFWGQQVMKNIVVCTTAGTTAEWWFNREDVGHPTWDALRRACTTSLGTIAFGSFFVAVIQTICYVMTKVNKYVEKYVSKSIACLIKIAVCCLKCLQKLMEMFNFYAYVVVGIYGYGYCHAAGHVMSIFFSRGLLLVEEGSLVSMVLALGVACVALSTAALTALIVSQNKDLLPGISYPVESAFTSGLAIGCGIAQIMFGVIEAANATVFISYIENPHALHNDHPKSYIKLHDAWVKMGKTEVEHDVAERFEETEEERAAALAEEGGQTKDQADAAASNANPLAKDQADE